MILASGFSLLAAGRQSGIGRNRSATGQRRTR